jgi:hypothetical protein
MIEKSVYQAPEGAAAVADEQFEFELAPPKELEDGSVEVTLSGEEETNTEGLKEFDANLAELLPEGVITALITEIDSLVEADIQSRRDWVDTYIQGLDVLGLKYEQRTDPWDGACGVYSSLLAEAAVRFQAETIMETFPAAGPVKTAIIGAVDKVKQAAAERVRADMNYQLTEKMSEYRPEHERMLFQMALAGSAFKKVYYDPSLARPVAMYISAEEVVVPYGASNVETSERMTHLLRKTRNEMDRMMADGFYKAVVLGDPTYFQTDIEQRKADLIGESYNATTDDRYQVREVHTLWHFDEDPLGDPDGVRVPYVITYEAGTQTVLSIRRNWKEEDAKKLRRQHFVHYMYVPGFGFYGMGLIHLIGGYARAGTSLIRQLVDAGTLSNLPGGLKARGLRVKGDDTPIMPGEWRDVDIASGKISDSVMPLPYKEPSAVLHALLKDITEEGRRLGAISDMDISDMSSQAPVGTTLALLERTLKPMSAVQARVHYTMKQEFKLLAALIRENLPGEYEYIPEDGTPGDREKDYAQVDVIPVSDPNSSTMAQRVVQHQAALEMAKTAPQIYNMPMLHRQMLETLGIKNVSKIIPSPEDQSPKDPISENMGFLTGSPVKAFIYQDHQAHITAHMVFLQDPVVQQMIGQNPQAQSIQAAIMAHNAEHLGYLYRRQIEERLGVPMPLPGEQLPEDVEIQLSRMVAVAGQQLLQIHQQQAAQEQAQAQAMDPLLKIEMERLEIEKGELLRKWAKDKGDQDIKELKIAVDAKRTGVMGRTQELQMQSRDRDSADKSFLALLKLIQSNSAGSSGPAEPGDPAGQAPQGPPQQ